MPKARKSIVDGNLLSNARIPWGTEIQKNMPSQWVHGRSWKHRRHVIPQHFLRAAWNKQMATQQPNKGQLAALYANLGGDRTCATEQDYASEILRTMNDHAGNLFLDDGPLNSAIGAVGYQFEDLAAQGRALLEEAGEVFTKASLAKGFLEIHGNPKWGKEAYKEVQGIIETYANYMLDSATAEEMIDWLEGLADTSNLDLNTKAGQAMANQAAIKIYERFLAATQNAPGWLNLAQLIQDFVGTKLVG